LRAHNVGCRRLGIVGRLCPAPVARQERDDRKRSHWTCPRSSGNTTSAGDASMLSESTRENRRELTNGRGSVTIRRHPQPGQSRDREGAGFRRRARKSRKRLCTPTDMGCGWQTAGVTGEAGYGFHLGDRHWRLAPVLKGFARPASEDLWGRRLRLFLMKASGKKWKPLALRPSTVTTY